MRSVTRTVWLTVILTGVLTGQVRAQEFRVYTRVFREDAASETQTNSRTERQVISRSVSLFHAGKVYDYIDGLGEVIIFEPAQRRFTVIDGAGTTATVVTFDELQHWLKLAEAEAERQAAELARRSGREASNAAEFLLFLVKPAFAETWDDQTGQLKLASPQYSYNVRCDSDVLPESIESYLRYADWTARLNAVLHPQTMLPAPRIALNDSLRAHRRLPVEVKLTIENGQSLRLRAEHTIHWNLDRRDRSNISHWETLVRNEKLRFVTFPEYQRDMLGGRTAAR